MSDDPIRSLGNQDYWLELDQGSGLWVCFAAVPQRDRFLVAAGQDPAGGQFTGWMSSAQALDLGIWLERESRRMRQG